MPGLRTAEGPAELRPRPQEGANLSERFLPLGQIGVKQLPDVDAATIAATRILRGDAGMIMPATRMTTVFQESSPDIATTG